MKIKVDVDATPQELRAFFGLPDVAPFHDEMITLMREKMRSGAEGYDPMTLMQQMLPSGMQGMEAMQKMFWESLRRGWGSNDDRGGKE